MTVRTNRKKPIHQGQQHGPTWTNMDQHGPTWTNMDQHGPTWTNMDQHGPTWTNMDQHGPTWTKTSDTSSHCKRHRSCPPSPAAPHLPPPDPHLSTGSHRILEATNAFHVRPSNAFHVRPCYMILSAGSPSNAAPMPRVCLTIGLQRLPSASSNLGPGKTPTTCANFTTPWRRRGLEPCQTWGRRG